MIRLLENFCILVLFASCSVISNFFGPDQTELVISQYKKAEENDYLMHLSYLGNYYKTTPGIKFVKVSEKSIGYLKSLYTKLVSENELIYRKKINPEFYIVEDKIPFFFSLPNGHFYFSSELINKYFKHEDMLISSLSSEIFRVHNGLYIKKMIVSTGFITTERLLSLLKLSEKSQAEIDKWAFYTMKRAGFDAIAYLSWLQVQNKNSMDFVFQHGGDTQKISRQEYVFKKFIVDQGITSDDTIRSERRSSTEFYDLKKEIARVEHGKDYR